MIDNPTEFEKDPMIEQESDVTEIERCIEEGKYYRLDDVIDVPKAKELIAFVDEMTRSGEHSAVIVIDSPGGVARVVKFTAEAMIGSKVKFYTLAYGRAQSAGFYVLMLGERRYVTPDAKLLAHGAQINMEKVRQLPEFRQSMVLEESLKDEDEIADKINIRTGIPKKEIIELTDKDYRLSPEQVLETGFVHGIFPKNREGVLSLIKGTDT